MFNFLASRLLILNWPNSSARQPNPSMSSLKEFRASNCRVLLPAKKFTAAIQVLFLKKFLPWICLIWFTLKNDQTQYLSLEICSGRTEYWSKKLNESHNLIQRTWLKTPRGFVAWKSCLPVQSTFITKYKIYSACFQVYHGCFMLRIAADRKKLSPQHWEYLVATGLVTHVLLLSGEEVQGERPQCVPAVSHADTSPHECGFGMTLL